MLREAERPPSGHPLGFTFATLTADNASLPDATFDAMFAYFMLYQVDDRPQAIRETARVLRPGGQLYAATNGAQHMVEPRLLAMNAGLMTPAEVEAGDAVEFSLENGADQFRAAFPLVELRRYEDRLVVDQAEPLLAYLLSTGHVQTTLTSLEPVNRVTTLRALIDEQLAVNGQIIVTKDSGVFIARRS